MFTREHKEMDVNTRNWIDSAQGLLENFQECGIETQDSISHGVSSRIL